MTLSFLGDVQAFLTRIFQHLDQAGLHVEAYELDHICYRVTTGEGYEQKKRELEPHAKLLTETLINGRLIATYELSEPILFRERRISLIELPQPKAGKLVREGLEHVEFVIDEDFPTFLRRYPHLAFDTRGMDKPHNPEVELNFADVNVKFHHIALKTQTDQG